MSTPSPASTHTVVRSLQLLIAGLAAAIALVFPAASAHAAADTSVTWSVAPANEAGPDGRSWVELMLDPGESVTEYVAVRNLGNSDATFRLSAADGYFTDTGRFNMRSADTSATGSGAWITLQDEITVAAGATAVVPYTITVPSNATPGDHAAGVAASVLSSGQDATGSQIGVESRVGFRVITQITGDLNPRLSLTEFTATYTQNWNPLQPGRVDLTYTAQNTGNLQLSFSDRLSSKGEPTDRGDLLPGEERTLSLTQTSVWPLGLVTAELQVIPDAADSEMSPLTQTITIWALPWPQLALLAGIALLVGGVLWGRRGARRRTEQMIAQAREEGRREGERRPGGSTTEPSH